MTKDSISNARCEPRDVVATGNAAPVFFVSFLASASEHRKESAFFNARALAPTRVRVVVVHV